MEKKIEIGLIGAVHRDRYEVMLKERRNVYARLKSGIYYREGSEESFPAVGDRVEIELNPEGDSLIRKTMPRKSWFSRLNPTPGMGEQVVAANFDYVFIVMSCEGDFNMGRLERYVTASWQSGGTPVVLLTKADRCADAAEKEALAALHAPGVEVIVTSAVTGEGLERAKTYLQPGKTVVFLGSSGVGKSTFINTILGREAMKTGDVRERDSKGRHTTTYRQLFLLPQGAMMIDTPGMRELGMWEVTEGKEKAFSDVEELIAGCRFGNCTHTNEPGCAVRAALETGALEEKRWKNYGKLLREAEYVQNRRKYHESMRKRVSR